MLCLSMYWAQGREFLRFVMSDTRLVVDASPASMNVQVCQTVGGGCSKPRQHFNGPSATTKSVAHAVRGLPRGSDAARSFGGIRDPCCLSPAGLRRGSLAHVLQHGLKPGALELRRHRGAREAT